jgi:hypothetical protein
MPPLPLSVPKNLNSSPYHMGALPKRVHLSMLPLYEVLALLARYLPVFCSHRELLRDYLVETCTIMEERFPEYDEWQAAGKREREEHRKQLDAVKDDPTATLLWTLERAKDYFASDEPEEQKTTSAASHLPSVDEPLLGSRSDTEAKRVGRNDPCPCRSGKKYKKC